MIKSPVKKLFVGAYASKVIDPTKHATIRISRGHPRWHRGYKDAGVIKALVPNKEWQKGTRADYRKAYYAAMDAVGVEQIGAQINELAGDRIPILMCFENIFDILAKTTWCHRLMFSQWWFEKTRQSAMDIDLMP